MKVGLVLPGGVDRSGKYRVIPCVLWLIERLARVHDLHVFALHQEPEPGRWDLLGAPVQNIGRHARVRRLTTALLTEHRKAPFDVLHVLWANWSAAVVGVIGKVLRRPVLLHLAGGEIVSIPSIGYGGRLNPARRALFRLAVQTASRVTAASNQLVAQGAALGIAVERLPLGVAVDRWPASPPRQRPPDSTPTLLHVASLNRVKDQATLLRAVAQVLDRGHHFHLDIVGEDTLDGEIQRLAKTLGLGQAVRFHGFLPHDQLRSFFDRAHLLLLTSMFEAGGLVVLEAAAAGIPTVGTAVGHIADLAPAGAVVVPVGDSGALARAIVDLIEDDAKRLQLARAAQLFALERDADWTANRVSEIYAEMVSRSRRVES
jgi:glycosyltransferase involved in cell wall biosynthesis